MRDIKRINVILHQALIESTKEVFSHLLSMDLHFEISEHQHQHIVGSISGLIGIRGTISGLIAIHCTQGMATKIASQMLGIHTKQISREVQDAIGELINIIAGTFKSKIDHGEAPFLLSTPTIMVGESYTINCLTKKANALFPFEYESENFWIEMSLTEDFPGAYVHQPRPN